MSEEGGGSARGQGGGPVDIEHDFFNKSTSLIVTHGERRKDYFADPAPPGEDDGEAEGETSLLPPLDPPADGASSFAGAVFNLANSTIGAGALGNSPRLCLIDYILSITYINE